MHLRGPYLRLYPADRERTCNKWIRVLNSDQAPKQLWIAFLRRSAQYGWRCCAGCMLAFQGPNRSGQAIAFMFEFLQDS